MSCGWKWYDLYRQIRAAGKAVQAIQVKPEEVLPLLDRVGPEGLYVTAFCGDAAQAETLLRVVEPYRRKEQETFRVQKDRTTLLDVPMPQETHTGDEPRMNTNGHESGSRTSLTEPDPLRLAGVFRSGMVPQREMPVPVWGRAVPGDTVTVEFKGQAKSAVAGADGRWSVILDALSADARPATLTASSTRDTRHATLTDILVGEVWLIAGQSNAGMSLRTFRDRAAAVGLKVNYGESPGGHDWACWDAQIQRVLGWLNVGQA